jgi:hypothetical protein
MVLSLSHDIERLNSRDEQMLYSGDGQGMVTGWADEEHHEVERLPRRMSGTFLRVPASGGTSRSADNIPRATSTSSLALPATMSASDIYPLSPRSGSGGSHNRPSSPTSLHQSVMAQPTRRSSGGSIARAAGPPAPPSPSPSSVSSADVELVARRYSFGLGSLRKASSTSSSTSGQQQ